MFKFLWIFNAIMSLIPVGYFFVGLADGSVTDRNMGMWLLILLLVALILLGSRWLRDHQRPRLAMVLLIIGGAPYALMIFTYVITIFMGDPGWH